ncbi:MAG: ABC transporter permease, partial [Bacteroidota bacterium]
SLLAATMILVVGWLLFDVTVRGNLFLLYAAIILFLIGGLGQGIFISTIAGTQQVAFIISIFSSLLPSFLLSGFIFPIDSMPVFLQVLSNIMPVKFFLVIVRSVILKGVGFAGVWEQFLYLALFGAIVLRISVFRLAKELSR